MLLKDVLGSDGATMAGGVPLMSSVYRLIGACKRGVEIADIHSMSCMICCRLKASCPTFSLPCFFFSYTARPDLNIAWGVNVSSKR